MKKYLKSLSFALVSVLSISLFVGTLTAAPRTMSDILTEEISQAASVSVPTVSENPNPTPTPQQPETVNTPAPVRTHSQTTSVSRGSSSSSTSNRSTAIISTAKRYLGVSYVWGGTTPSGFDCSGFTQYVFAQHGISLPRISRDQFNSGAHVSLNNLQPGDLVFFSLDQDKVIDHVGIYTGSGQFINASSSKGVTIYSLGSYWSSHLIGATRVL
ncbi:C40 family peptidase [Desulfitobacterium sp. Sab5]|uniref:C40 family peptidase n=1 Tax=Desulfitobacterium nosdiversum TaxID=3375356 RepID=UPI003CEAF8AB